MENTTEVITPSEGELMWEILKSNHAVLAHQWAHELQNACHDSVKFHALADQYLGQALARNFSIEQLAKLVSTWIGPKGYNLPLNPSKMSTIDEFHMRCGQYVANHFKEIVPFVEPRLI